MSGQSGTVVRLSREFRTDIEEFKTDDIGYKITDIEEFKTDGIWNKVNMDSCGIRCVLCQ